ncbi:hypothetical protein DdX_20932 [Ditylenchus destructor]|uniref:Uncharacterized protein n=1 Tax=Ditylenchus destructor TaxID=166010 RepID=A0AAD4MFK2_9BILA|nr:hypothetical protein DdX_20932 [Ditylenchus destructor]
MGDMRGGPLPPGHMCGQAGRRVGEPPADPGQGQDEHGDPDRLVDRHDPPVAGQAVVQEAISEVEDEQRRDQPVKQDRAA